MESINLPVELLHKLVDALNDARPDECFQVLDELTECAERQNVPVWFGEDRKPLWTTKPKAG